MLERRTVRDWSAWGGEGGWIEGGERGSGGGRGEEEGKMLEGGERGRGSRERRRREDWRGREAKKEGGIGDEADRGRAKGRQNGDSCVA